MEAAYRRIAVAAKNVDTREHDIADSDDYFQYHGGMVATVRALTGSAPRAYVGDSTRPESVRTRSLTEETSRVFRARVVNPRWLAAMRRHGYKGAFELAATVDYLFGYDATTGVVADWMYEKLAQTYVLDPENRAFLEQSNPWALHGIAERLLEAVDRQMWAEPDPQLLAELQQAYLDTEGDLEGGGTPPRGGAGGGGGGPPSRRGEGGAGHRRPRDLHRPRLRPGDHPARGPGSGDPRVLGPGRTARRPAAPPLRKRTLLLPPRCRSSQAPAGGLLQHVTGRRPRPPAG